ncbi:transposase [Oscillatoriales cyanobacterium USR001]|nr:transposase [Oscillatoriales cyanobacterium USR001]
MQVKRSGNRGAKSYEETAYYLSSICENAEVFGERIQGHWRIENQLHWIKDVLFKEDKSPLHQSGPMTNLSILSTIAINIFRILGFLSITEGRRWLCERFWRLTILLA